MDLCQEPRGERAVATPVWHMNTAEYPNFRLSNVSLDPAVVDLN